ncbi:sulfatase [Shinella curvata]|uniref:Sulfatase n=1 Tax=Shinella curvata TaxID=1817964 RepID=A0ABT8X922_9HYPH|nr:sulfatase-like hydrolase/transferase [Shinella curvata]MCJ8052123.1 sulfatase [Shinella curvata]MDO6119929.1 sulfatase [Shinella curvata]
MAHIISRARGRFGLFTSPYALVLGSLFYFAFAYYFDTRWRYLPYNFAAILTLASIIFLISRRPFFSLYGATLVAVLFTFVSMMKFHSKGLALHVYDVVFIGSDISTLSFLVRYYLPAVLVAAVGLAAIATFLTILFRRENPAPWGAGARSGIVAASLLAAVIAHRPTTRDADFLPFIGGYNASAFFLSLWHIPSLMKPMQFATPLDGAEAGQPFVNGALCGDTGKQPDLFLTLSESQTSPLVFPQLSIPQSVTQTYQSGDGKIRPLFVEIFGGGTWMTNFSVLTGLSTADFGWLGPYVNHLLVDKVRGSLPEVLGRCGYRTVAFMPMQYNSINEGPFLKSLGFQEIYDADRMSLPVMGVRDTNYFDNAKAMIAQHRKDDKRPLFVLVQTMFTHSPYENTIEPVVAGEHVYADDAGANEYLRRVGASRNDLVAYREAVKADPGTRGSVFLEFGDHQSIATKPYILERTDDDNPFTTFRSPVYETFYAIHGFGTPVDYDTLDIVDAPFLMSRILAATDLPSSPVFDDLAMLSDVCRGEFHTCAQRAEVDRHIRRRMDADMLQLN